MNTTGERQRLYVFSIRPVVNKTGERQRSYVFSIRPVDEQNWKRQRSCFLQKFLSSFSTGFNPTFSS